MLRSTQINRRPLTIVMLIMVLWQCLFVAVEAGAHSLDGADIHHPVAVQQHADSHAPCPQPSCTGERSEANHSAANDTCDHCCACQGHAAHISIHVKITALELSAPGYVLARNRQQFYSLHPPSIFRPPIC